MAIGLVASLLPTPGVTQTASFWLETGAGQARWATGNTLSSRLTYGSLGARALWHPPGAVGGETRLAAGLGGDDQSSAGWVSADAEIWLRHAWGPVLGRLSLEGWGLRYDQESRYDAAGVRVMPTLDWRSRAWTVRVRGDAALGGWRLTADTERGPPGPVPGQGQGPPSQETQTGTLRLLGGGLELLHARGPLWFRVGPTAFRSEGRVPDLWQVAGEGEVGMVAGPLTLSAGARWLSAVATDSAPRTSSVGGVARARIAVAERWAVTLQYDGRPWDPMHAVQRGTAMYAGLEWRAAPTGRPRLPVVELGGWTETGRNVRFRLDAREASRVELLGDFSGWQPVVMTRRGSVWEAEVVIPPGTHHFGFLLDGETWMVPTHTPGLVTDGWQRRNGTIVISEPAP